MICVFVSGLWTSTTSVMLTLCSNVPAVAQAYITPALMTSDSTVIDGDVCPRCSKQVFIAEKRQAAGKVLSLTSHVLTVMVALR